MSARKASQDGFTIIEILVSLVLLAIGVLGSMAIHTSALSANRFSNRFSRATTLAQSLMEEVRQKDLDTLGATTSYSSVTQDGVVYTRTVTKTAVSGTDNLYRLKGTVSFPREGDTEQLASASMELLRNGTDLL